MELGQVLAARLPRKKKKISRCEGDGGGSAYQEEALLIERIQDTQRMVGTHGEPASHHPRQRWATVARRRRIDGQWFISATVRLTPSE